MKKETTVCDDCEENDEEIYKCKICPDNIELCEECMKSHFEEEHLEEYINENTESVDD